MGNSISECINFMNINFNSVVISSKETPFTKEEQINLFKLIGQKNLKGIIDSEELFMFVSELFGEQRNLKVFLKENQSQDLKIHQFVNRIEEIVKTIRYSIDNLSISADTIEDFSYRANNFYQYGRFYSKASGVIVIEGLTPEEIEKIRSSTLELHLNDGDATIL